MPYAILFMLMGAIGAGLSLWWPAKTNQSADSRMGFGAIGAIFMCICGFLACSSLH